MFARASLVALALASPAWADPDYPAGLFERSPLNGPPAAVSRRRGPHPKRKTRPASAPAAPAIIIASGAIRGRNHADPLFQRRVRERVVRQRRVSAEPLNQAVNPIAPGPPAPLALDADDIGRELAKAARDAAWLVGCAPIGARGVRPPEGSGRLARQSSKRRPRCAANRLVSAPERPRRCSLRGG